jgi:hypothetical protein
MNTQQYGKKEAERIAFDAFALAYEYATGDGFEIVACGERPDFVCRRADGALRGVELTEVRCEPWSSPFDALDQMWHAMCEKDRKRGQDDWRCAEQAILVLELTGASLSDLEWALDDLPAGDFAQFGFREIWLVDYSTVDAFGEVELYCMRPESMRGRYPRAHPDKKPYG